MTEDQIKHMVNRFLGWKLPDSFNPDAGISFKAVFNENTAHPMKHEPSGTNLFDATQADAMVRHMIKRMPLSSPESTAGRDSVSDDDRRLMGTRQEADADLITKARAWREIRQPTMATATQHRECEKVERQLRFELANAALHWLWHVEHPMPLQEDAK